MTREQSKIILKNLIENLKSMSDDYEELFNEMDNLTDEEFDAKASKIEEKYSKNGIELFNI